MQDRIASRRIASHCFIGSHRIASRLITLHRIGSHGIGSHRIGSHHTASHRIATHRIASYRVASHRIASRHIFSLAQSHRIASYRIESDIIGSDRVPPFESLTCGVSLSIGGANICSSEAASSLSFDAVPRLQRGGSCTFIYSMVVDYNVISMKRLKCHWQTLSARAHYEADISALRPNPFSRNGTVFGPIASGMMAASCKLLRDS